MVAIFLFRIMISWEGLSVGVVSCSFACNFRVNDIFYLLSLNFLEGVEWGNPYEHRLQFCFAWNGLVGGHGPSYRWLQTWPSFSYPDHLIFWPSQDHTLWERVKSVTRILQRFCPAYALEPSASQFPSFNWIYSIHQTQFKLQLLQIVVNIYFFSLKPFWLFFWSFAKCSFVKFISLFTK